jgi:hypothetical protein
MLPSASSTSARGTGRRGYPARSWTQRWPTPLVVVTVAAMGTETFSALSPASIRGAQNQGVSHVKWSWALWT